ncbi:multifunctional procollagen lysine hydroxylase and glycosyltransferase LH3-like, partial [Passerculus sandwichensis]
PSLPSYDVVFAGPPKELLAKFRAGLWGVLFAAEGFCWPRRGWPRSTPPSPPGGKPFLNSGGFVGYAPALWALVERWHYRDDDDDQLFYTQLYLDRELREQLGLGLDHHSRIFQNLNGALDEVRIRFEPGGNRVRNEVSGSWPVVIHGNGPTKVALNSLGNYVPQGWSPGGCGDCDSDLRPLRGTPAEALPWVLIGVFVAEPTPFLPQFLRRLRELSYPRERLGLFLHNAVPGHALPAGLALAPPPAPLQLRPPRGGGAGGRGSPRARHGKGAGRELSMYEGRGLRERGGA